MPKQYSAASWRVLRQIRIDEVLIRRGHYLTLVADMRTGKVVFAGRGRCDGALETFWEKLQEAGAAIDIVAMDMSSSSVGAVLCHLPRATFVFDRFHVTKLFTSRLCEFHRTLCRKTKEPCRRRVLEDSLYPDVHRFSRL